MRNAYVFLFIDKLKVDAAQDELKVLEGELSSIQELNFAFQRAASRLKEISGQEYLERWKTIHKK